MKLLLVKERVRSYWPHAICFEQEPPSGTGYIVKPTRRSVTVLGRGDSREAAWRDALDYCRQTGPVHAPDAEIVSTEPMTDAAPDMVNRPPHYTASGIECIDAIKAALTPEEFRGFCKGNSLKYAWREKHKGGDEDLKKAAWYLKRLTES